MNDADPKKGLAAAQTTLESHGLEISDENLFIAATCGDKGIAFLKGESPLGIRKVEAEQPASVGPKPSVMRVTVGGDTFTVEVRDGETFVDGERFSVSLDQDTDSERAAEAGPSSGGTTLRSDLAAKVLRIPVSEGQTIRSGDTVLVLEALKMEMEVTSPADGKVSRSMWVWELRSMRVPNS